MAAYLHNDSIDQAHKRMEDFLGESDNERAVIAGYSDGTALVYLSNKIDIDKLKYLLDTKQLDKGEVK